jgi:ADP-ribosylation factor GTPase-activating protein 2/3
MRVMKVGGNASFHDFLARHPGSSSSSADTKEKYLSRAAGLYKDELAKRCLEDERQFGPGKVIVEGTSADKDAAPAKSDADFFDTWDAPPAAKKALAPPASTPPLISFGLSPGNTPLNSRPSSPRAPSPAPTPVAAAPAAPRTVTSSSLRTTTASGSTTSTARPKMTLGARTTFSAAGGAGVPAGRGKLGVKRGGTVNFEEAERKAKEEEERIKKLGYDSRQEQEAAAAAAAASAKSSYASRAESTTNGKGGHIKKDSIETERLGMGIKRLGFGQVAGISGEQSAKDAAKAAKAATRRANGYDDDQPGALYPHSLSCCPALRTDELCILD